MIGKRLKMHEIGQGEGGKEIKGKQIL